MARAVKRWMGFVLILIGLVMVGESLMAFIAALLAPEHGIKLLVLAGCAIGFACFGGAYDLLTGSRGRTEAENNGIAHSIWAGRDHLADFNVTEE